MPPLHLDPNHFFACPVSDSAFVHGVRENDERCQITKRFPTDASARCDGATRHVALFRITTVIFEMCDSL